MTRSQWRIVGGLSLLFGFWALTRSGNGLRPVPPDSEFDKKALSAGTQVELEHTTSTAMAKKIAKHHLLEDPDYYRKLATIED